MGQPANDSDSDLLLQDLGTSNSPPYNLDSPVSNRTPGRMDEDSLKRHLSHLRQSSWKIFPAELATLMKTATQLVRQPNQ